MEKSQYEQFKEEVYKMLAQDQEKFEKAYSEVVAELQKETDASILQNVFSGKKKVSDELAETENGALAYKNYGNDFVDLVYSLPKFRTAEGEELERLKDLFRKCLDEDIILACRLLFYIGDVREGAGERRAFVELYSVLLEDQGNAQRLALANKFLQFVPIYTRYDMWFKLLEKAASFSRYFDDYDFVFQGFRDTLAELLVNQVREDVAKEAAGEPCSLLCKWLPSINTSSKKTKQLAFEVMRMLRYNPKDNHQQAMYRKFLSRMRKYINVVERNMSTQNWEGIDYKTVPSKAALQYKDAFMRHDAERYNRYIEAAAEGSVKFNATVTNPYEIVYKIRKQGVGYNDLRFDNESKDKALIAAWKNLKNVSVDNSTIVVADTSGSMTTSVSKTTKATMMDVALSLAYYCAERLHGSLQGKFITFSSRPSFVDISNGNDPYDYLERTSFIVENTDVEAVFELLIQAYRMGDLDKVDMPKNILIISDMQFDESRTDYEKDDVLMNMIAKRWWNSMVNAPMPKLIFWNLNNRYGGDVPMKENENGLILMSGFSVNLLNMATSGEYEPFKALLKVINSDRYNQIEEQFHTVI